MNSNQAQLEKLARERAEIARSGRLHAVHWLVVFLSLVLTVGAWYFAKQQVAEKAETRFTYNADQVLALVSERMRKYEDGLWGGVAAIQANGGNVSVSEWKVFADSLRIAEKYPGINGIGVIHFVPGERLETYLADQRQTRPGYRIHPPHTRADFLPITYIEPAGPNKAAVGLDMAHETNRYTAALKARETGRAQITGPIVLVQDQARTPGFLFYAPWYRGGVFKTSADRRRNFAGMVYAPFVFHKLMQGVLRKDQREVRIRVRDAGSLLYDEIESAENAGEISAAFRKTASLDLYGRTWQFDIQATTAFVKGIGNDQPIIILAGGLLIDSLLFALFVFLSRSNRRALSFADRMTRELKLNAEALSKSNEELEKFAYVTSHDLKTPLRGIGDLTEYLEEDLEPYMNRSDANPDIRKNINRLNQQTRRMENLIRGILDYSAIRAQPAAAQRVDLEALIRSLVAENGFSGEQLSLIGDFPTFTTDVVRLQQILANLISNARKYHHDPGIARLTIGIQKLGTFYRISVADNGPGIDPQFHSRIFEVFQTLQSRDVIESTGIGLSIVKKSVELYGGSVRVISDGESGTEFTFEWPAQLEACLEERMAA